VRDEAGQVVRRLDGPAAKGFHRVAWDMRYPAPNPVELGTDAGRAPWEDDPAGPMVLPGRYTVSLSRRVEGHFEDIAGPQTVVLKPLFSGGLVTDDRAGLLEFQQKSAELYRAVLGADRAAGEIEGRIDHLLQAVTETPGADEAQARALRDLRARMQDLRVQLNGDRTVTSRNEPAPMAIRSRVARIVNGSWGSQSEAGGTFRDSYAVAAQQFPVVLDELRAVAGELETIERALEAEGAPWTPSRIPDWRR